jgi:hypothetical protein
MTGDLLADLRAFAAGDFPAGSAGTNAAARICGEAATEINRLRIALAGGRAEVERLQYLVDKQGETIAQAMLNGLPPLPWKAVETASDTIVDSTDMHIVDANGRELLEILRGDDERRKLISDTLLTLVNQPIGSMQGVTADGGQPALVFPTDLTGPIREVLGLPIFQTGPIAHGFRAAGHDIPPKVEAEQAFVLHRLLLLALKHGSEWRKFAADDIADMVEKAKAAEART